MGGPPTKTGGPEEALLSSKDKEEVLDIKDRVPLNLFAWVRLTGVIGAVSPVTGEVPTGPQVS